MPIRKSRLQIVLQLLLLLSGLLLASFLYLSAPPDPDLLVSRPDPVANYEQAVQRIQALQDSEDPALNPVCHLKFMDHGAKTERVIVFIHGYANCPEQFRKLGEQFFAQGYNVLIATQPYMGLADRLNSQHELLTAEQLAAYTDEVVDIAQGLGEHVSLAGLSGGGIMTAWAAEKRSDLDLAVILAPSFGYTFLPGPLTVPVMNLFLRLPNVYQWWDPTRQMNTTPLYGYPRFSTRALAQILRMASIVRVQACVARPAAGEILVITNDGDVAVVNALTDQVIQCWQEQGFSALRSYQFPASLKLEHDLIDPNQPSQRADIVYPQIIDLVTDRQP